MVIERVIGRDLRTVKGLDLMMEKATGSVIGWVKMMGLG